MHYTYKSKQLHIPSFGSIVWGSTKVITIPPVPVPSPTVTNEVGIGTCPGAYCMLSKVYICPRHSITDTDR